MKSISGALSSDRVATQMESDLVRGRLRGPNRGPSISYDVAGGERQRVEQGGGVAAEPSLFDWVCTKGFDSRCCA